MTAAEIYSEVAAIVAAADDPDALRHDVLRRCRPLGDAVGRPGDPPPDNSLDGRWRRALAAGPETVLGTLQRAHPPASCRVFGNNHEFELTLPNGGGRIVVRYLPGKA